MHKFLSDRFQQNESDILKGFNAYVSDLIESSNNDITLFVDLYSFNENFSNLPRWDAELNQRIVDMTVTEYYKYMETVISLNLECPINLEDN